jgi:hypothetical protein
MKKVSKASIKRFFEGAHKEGKSVYLTHEILTTYFSNGEPFFTEKTERVTDEKRTVKKLQSNAVVFEVNGKQSYLYFDNDTSNPQHCDDTSCSVFFEVNLERGDVEFEGKIYNDVIATKRQTLLYKVQ